MNKRTPLLPILILFLATVIYFPAIVFQGHTFVSSGMVLSDLFLFNYPLKSLMHQTLLNTHSIPYWTDLIGNGYPIFAEGQMGALYPFHLLFFSLPFSTISLFNTNLILHYLLSSIFVYLYVNKYIKINKYVSLLGAFIFTFSGYMLTHLHQVNIILVITYLPLNFYLIEKIFELKKESKISTKLFLALLITITLYAQITAGHIEMVYYNFLFTAIYTVLRFTLDPKVRSLLVQKISILIVAAVFSVLLALPQIMATAELVSFSQREEGLSYEHSTGALWPAETLILFINPKAYDVYRKEPGYSPNNPDTVNIGALYPYIGILPLLLTVVAIAQLIRKQKKNGEEESEYQASKKMWILLYLLLLVLTYVYAIGRSTQLFAVFWEIVPGLKYFRFPIKALYVIELSLAILATIGLQEIYEIANNKTKNTHTNKNTKNNQNLAINQQKNQKIEIDPQRFSGKKAGKISFATGVVALLILVSYIDLWANNRSVQPTIPADDWLKTPEFAKYIKEKEAETQQNGYVDWRTYSHGTNNIDYGRIFDFTLQKEIQNILHIDYNLVHNVALNREWAVLFLQRQSMLNQFNSSIHFEPTYLLLPDTLKKSLDLQSVRFLLTDLPIQHPDLTIVKELQLTKPVDHVIYMAKSTTATYLPVDKLYIYENNKYVPRINLTAQSSAIQLKPEDKTAKNILEAALDPKFDPTKQTIIETDNPIQQTNSTQSFQSSYKVLSYLPEQFTIEIESNQDAIFSIEDTYYPGWEATVDDKPTQILKANYAFRAVAIPAGKHTLSMKFQPKYLGTEALVQKIGWAIIIALFAVLAVPLLKKPKKE